MFHSSGDAIGEEMIIDLKKAYQLDKFEYYARNDNYGNGTVNRMTISVSLDAVSYTHLDVYKRQIMILKH